MVNNAISRPTEILIALINVLLHGDLCIECFAPDGDAAFDFAAYWLLGAEDGFHE